MGSAQVHPVGHEDQRADSTRGLGDWAGGHEQPGSQQPGHGGPSLATRLTASLQDIKTGPIIEDQWYSKVYMSASESCTLCPRRQTALSKERAEGANEVKSIR